MSTGKISDCCGAEATGEMEDVGICPDCKEHCEFVDLEEDFTEIQLDKTTLPDHEKEVEWVNDNEDKRTGFYDAEEGLFHVRKDGGEFDFAWHVTKWRYVS